MLHSIFCGRTLSRESLRFELLHGFHKPGHALDGHGVIDAGAHAADEAVAFEVHKTLRGGEFDERRAGFYGGCYFAIPSASNCFMASTSRVTPSTGMAL